MYYMKNIISHDEKVALPKCMYEIKNPNKCLKSDDIDIKITEQVPNKNMADLEDRQNQLLKKLDNLYERIKTISSYCTNVKQDVKIQQKKIPAPEEVVLAVSPDNLPWFLNIFLKASSLPVNVSWHIHSSVSNEKVPKIKAFLNNLKNMEQNSKVNLRLIFKNVSAGAELKLSSLSVPVLGNVNILRYLAYVYPTVIPYDDSNYQVDSLLDHCHILEKTPEKNKEAVLKKIFSQHKTWIYNNEFSIIDLAVYNVVKQWQNIGKYVPKTWFDNCEKLSM